jgi:hypothetical protein
MCAELVTAAPRHGPGSPRTARGRDLPQRPRPTAAANTNSEIRRILHEKRYPPIPQENRDLFRQSRNHSSQPPRKKSSPPDPLAHDLRVERGLGVARHLDHTWISAGPISVTTVFARVPLREFRPVRPAAGSCLSPRMRSQVLVHRRPQRVSGHASRAVRCGPGCGQWSAGCGCRPWGCGRRRAG